MRVCVQHQLPRHTERKSRMTEQEEEIAKVQMEIICETIEGSSDWRKNDIAAIVH